MLNGAQIHLSLVHFPVVMTVLALVAGGLTQLQLFSRWRGLALGLTILAGLSVLPVFFTGEGAEDVVKPLVEKSFIHEHEEAGEFALAVTLAAGGLALLMLSLAKFKKAVPGFLPWVLLAAQLISVGATLRTAHLGGLIRHTEIRDGAAPAKSDSGKADHD